MQVVTRVRTSPHFPGGMLSMFLNASGYTSPHLTAFFRWNAIHVFKCKWLHESAPHRERNPLVSSSAGIFSIHVNVVGWFFRNHFVYEYPCPVSSPGISLRPQDFNCDILATLNSFISKMLLSGRTLMGLYLG
uniref:Uncharacterized protein n=1 Tax=Timema genevievae TaxID=629358 RepID=A0A7R9JPM3_TIMGE|nr:unnamed protein product [Timema genevievae]